MNNHITHITIEHVLAAHERALQFGGLAGIRDRNALYAAIAQPWSEMMGVEFYPTIVEKACRLAYEIITQHPFADGNKRTALLVLVTFLDSEGIAYSGDKEQLHHMILSLASGEAEYEDLVTLISQANVSTQS